MDPCEWLTMRISHLIKFQFIIEPLLILRDSTLGCDEQLHMHHTSSHVGRRQTNVRKRIAE